jgi:hypothetical protein
MRKVFSVSPALIGVATALMLTGCVVATRVPSTVLYVDRAPPVAYNEAVLASPGPGYVWINGYYSWTGREYYWNRGHWTLPVRGYNHWNQGYWQRDPRGHYWVPGHWR